MEPLSVVVRVDARLARASYRACHRRAYLTRWAVTAAFVVAGVLARSVPLVVGGVGAFSAGVLQVRSRLRTYRSGPRDMTVTVTEDEYRTQSAVTTTARSWSTFQTVSRVGRFWVLRTAASGAMALPQSALDADQTAAFEDLLARKGLAGS